MEVAQLVGAMATLIRSITREVETARQNKQECEHLAGLLSTIDGVLSTLPQDPEVVPLLKELGKTLGEAHALVVTCQNWSAVNHFFSAGIQAESFRRVNTRINSHLSLFHLVVYSVIAGRLGADRIHPPDHAGVPATSTVPSPVSSCGSLETQKVAPDLDLPRIFTWDEIAVATYNFAVELGGSSCLGRVYKGRLPHDGPEVAVKLLDDHVEHAFVAELEVLFSLRHDHIVGLVGWCPEEKGRMFLYEHEHMINGTLRDHLVHVGMRARMRVRLAGGYSSTPARVSWRTRVEVLLGASRAIEHLHCNDIIHLDVSSSNILLDATWTPRLYGFGAAVLQAPATAGEEPGCQLAGEVACTPGYLDPEYLDTGLVSPASDVYSFGVVMLEALTGQDPATLQVDSSLLAIRDGKLRGVMDSRPATLRQLEALEIVGHTAGRCLCQQGKDRPTMREVVAGLPGEGARDHDYAVISLQRRESGFSTANYIAPTMDNESKTIKNS